MSADEGLVVSISEIGELSEKYEGEDEIVDVLLPYLHVIVPLKTVEAGVKMYNTIGNAMKTSAETFVRELASAKQTYARVRPNKMSSLHSLKSLRRARSKSSGQSKVFSSTIICLPKEKVIFTLVMKTIELIRMLVNDEINLHSREKGIRHSIALKLNVRANTIILECKYDLKDPLAEVCLNNIEMIYLKHGNTIPLLTREHHKQPRCYWFERYKCISCQSEL